MGIIFLGARTFWPADVLALTFWPSIFLGRIFWPGSIFCIGQSKILVVKYYLVRTFISTQV